MSDHNSYALEIANAALADLRSISAYTSEQWGARQAEVYTAALYETFIALQASPLTGSTHYGVPDSIRGRKSGSHIVFYRVDGDTLYIMRVLHESMDHGRHLDADA